MSTAATTAACVAASGSVARDGAWRAALAALAAVARLTVVVTAAHDVRRIRALAPTTRTHCTLAVVGSKRVTPQNEPLHGASWDSTEIHMQSRCLPVILAHEEANAPFSVVIATRIDLVWHPDVPLRTLAGAAVARLHTLAAGVPVALIPDSEDFSGLNDRQAFLNRPAASRYLNRSRLIDRDFPRPPSPYNCTERLLLAAMAGVRVLRYPTLAAVACCAATPGRAGRCHSNITAARCVPMCSRGVRHGGAKYPKEGVLAAHNALALASGRSALRPAGAAECAGESMEAQRVAVSKVTRIARASLEYALCVWPPPRGLPRSRKGALAALHAEAAASCSALRGA